MVDHPVRVLYLRPDSLPDVFPALYPPWPHRRPYHHGLGVGPGHGQRQCPLVGVPSVAVVALVLVMENVNASVLQVVQML